MAFVMRLQTKVVIQTLHKEMVNKALHTIQMWWIWFLLAFSCFYLVFNCFAHLLWNLYYPVSSCHIQAQYTSISWQDVYHVFANRNNLFSNGDGNHHKTLERNWSCSIFVFRLCFAFVMSEFLFPWQQFLAGKWLFSGTVNYGVLTATERALSIETWTVLNL